MIVYLVGTKSIKGVKLFGGFYDKQKADSIRDDLMKQNQGDEQFILPINTDQLIVGGFIL